MPDCPAPTTVRFQPRSARCVRKRPTVDSRPAITRYPHRKSFAGTIVCGLLLSGLTAEAVPAQQPPTQVVVPGYQRFRDTHLQPQQAGMLLISELNCQSCHGPAFSDLLPARQAPVLTNVANRSTVEHLRQFIADPQQVKPGTAMPDLFSHQSAAESAHAVEALVHFLAADGAVAPSPVSSAAVLRGEQLFHQVGCAACHGDQRSSDKEQPDFLMPLGPVDKKYTVSSLATFLEDPHAVRPSGRMPSLNLTAEEARDVASYLLKEIDVEPNLTVEIYEGWWEQLPDFSQLSPQTTVATSDFDVQVAGKQDGFALRYHGFLHLPRTGKYDFYLGSDDGSRLLIDNQEVLNADGIHPHSVKHTQHELTAGVHRVVVEYFEGGGEESLSVEIKGKDLSRQTLAGLISITDQPPAKRRSFRPDPGLVAAGRQLFASAGCASCHSYETDGQPIATELKPPQFADMNLHDGTPPGGCLADQPNVSAAPRFALSDVQRQDILTALTADFTQSTESKSPQDQIAGILLTLNCYACHQRQDLGGVPERMNELFTGRIPEMGDEGRIPPRLDGVGDKLSTHWLKEVMNNGAKDRPYMDTRMPKFGSRNVGPLIDLFVSADRRAEVGEVSFDDPPHRVIADARLMVGDQALSCIKCHTFGKFQATGIQSVDMTTMTTRLRRDWFHRYLLDPQAYRPGTRMPAAWPNHRSVVPHILDGSPERQIEAIWQYLEDGTKARVPSGLLVDAIELKPVQRPRIYRNFIQGLSPRGIAVGYPEQAHLAWDAQQMNLRLIWHGAFIDASKHWTGRGQGTQTPLGDHVLNLPDGPPLASLDNADTAWPDQSARSLGFEFDGYQLDPQGRPAFQYSWNGVTVADFFEPVAADDSAEASLIRTVTLTADKPEPGLWYRLANAAVVERTQDRWLIDNALSLTFLDGQPELRQQGGKQELLVPIVFDGTGTAVIRYRMTW